MFLLSVVCCLTSSPSVFKQHSHTSLLAVIHWSLSAPWGCPHSLPHGLFIFKAYSGESVLLISSYASDVFHQEEVNLFKDMDETKSHLI
jgi:hypothetical protein